MACGSGGGGQEAEWCPHPGQAHRVGGGSGHHPAVPATGHPPGQEELSPGLQPGAGEHQPGHDWPCSVFSIIIHHCMLVLPFSFQ